MIKFFIASVLLLAQNMCMASEGLYLLETGGIIPGYRNDKNGLYEFRVDNIKMLLTDRLKILEIKSPVDDDDQKLLLEDLLEKNEIVLRHYAAEITDKEIEIFFCNPHSYIDPIAPLNAFLEKYKSLSNFQEQSKEKGKVIEPSAISPMYRSSSRSSKGKEEGLSEEKRLGRSQQDKQSTRKEDQHNLQNQDFPQLLSEPAGTATIATDISAHSPSRGIGSPHGTEPPLVGIVSSTHINQPQASEQNYSESAELDTLCQALDRIHQCKVASQSYAELVIKNKDREYTFPSKEATGFFNHLSSAISRLLYITTRISVDVIESSDRHGSLGRTVYDKIESIAWRERINEAAQEIIDEYRVYAALEADEPQEVGRMRLKVKGRSERASDHRSHVSEHEGHEIELEWAIGNSPPIVAEWGYIRELEIMRAARLDWHPSRIEHADRATRANATQSLRSSARYWMLRDIRKDDWLLSVNGNDMSSPPKQSMRRDESDGMDRWWHEDTQIERKTWKYRPVHNQADFMQLMDNLADAIRSRAQIIDVQGDRRVKNTQEDRVSCQQSPCTFASSGHEPSTIPSFGD